MGNQLVGLEWRGGKVHGLQKQPGQFFGLYFIFYPGLTSLPHHICIINCIITPDTYGTFHGLMWFIIMYKGPSDSFETDQRIVSPLYCVSSWQLANSSISLQELRNCWMFLHTLLRYCFSYLNLEIRKAPRIGPFYIEHIVSNLSSSPCPLKYFIAVQSLIQLASNLYHFVAIIYLYNLSLHY